MCIRDRDRIVEHGSPKELHRECGYDAQGIAEAVREMSGQEVTGNVSIAG